MNDINRLKDSINISYNVLIRYIEKLQDKCFKSDEISKIEVLDMLMDLKNEVRDDFDYSFIEEDE